MNSSMAFNVTKLYSNGLFGWPKRETGGPAEDDDQPEKMFQLQLAVFQENDARHLDLKDRIPYYFQYYSEWLINLDDPDEPGDDYFNPVFLGLSISLLAGVWLLI
ncbi:unnamed protein product [Ambrosiozyma monospora]|uniref:Unnamed protein product n=1 Tax=Ambrosiozyma monospora TaxID=43982 RepID=A0A9W6YWD1_AMBMO|nr:unnamed protein product [Ambrosiozyma monospora]